MEEWYFHSGDGAKGLASLEDELRRSGERVVRHPCVDLGPRAAAAGRTESRLKKFGSRCTCLLQHHRSAQNFRKYGEA